MTDHPHRSRSPWRSKWLRDVPSALARALAPVVGYGVTISSTFHPVVTEQYPFESPQVMPRYHGCHQLNRYSNGLKECIGCGLCAWACLADVIYVEVASNEPDAQCSPGGRYGCVYQINYLRCIFCGMCIEACPTRTLTMSTNFDELVDPGREGLTYEKEDLLVPVPGGAVSAPRPMVEGTEDDGYYRGEVVGSVQTQIDWVRSHRPEDPSLEPAHAKATPTTSGQGSRHTVRGTLR